MAKLETLIEVLDRSKKRLLFALFVATLVHLPLTPGMSLLSLAQRLSGAKHGGSPAPAPAPREVEVELQEALRNEEQRLEDTARATPDTASVQVDSPAPASVKFAKSETTPPQVKPAEAAPKPLKADKVKELGLEGDLAEKMVGRPAVTLGFWFSSLRGSSLGEDLVQLASCNREWKRFIDQGIDLPKEIDGVLVVGPGLFDSSQLTVAVGHAVSAERVHGVMDALVKESGERGRWLLPDVAAARFGGRDRVLLPLRPDLFFVTPRKGWEALHRVKSPLRVPSAEGRAASLTLVKPNTVLERVGLELPSSITELRLEAFANADRSLDIKLELLAKTEEAARRAEKAASRQLRDFFGEAWTMAWALGTIAGTGSGEHEAVPRLDLAADGETLRGQLRLSANQTRALLALLASFQCKKSRPVAPAAAASDQSAEHPRE